MKKMKKFKVIITTLADSRRFDAASPPHFHLSDDWGNEPRGSTRAMQVAGADFAIFFIQMADPNQSRAWWPYPVTFIHRRECISALTVRSPDIRAISSSPWRVAE